MPLRKPLLVLFALFLIPFAAPGQDAKQELNDQFWEAVRKGDLPAVTALLDKGADVNAKFRYGSTALFKAAERGHADIVKLLLARGADVKVKDTYYGATAMTWALQNDHIEAVRALLEKDTESLGEVLLTGAREGKLELVRAAVDKGGLKPEALTAALASAMTEDKKNVEMIELLKKAGAQPPLEVDAATLQSYVGKYKGDPGPEMSISVKDGRLVAGQGAQSFGMMAVDKVTFKPLDFDGMTVAFTVEGGKAVGFSLTQRGTTTQLKRIAEQ
jgi:ankyrin repeat protein